VRSYIVDEFLEKNNMTYLFLILANLEAERLNNLPESIKKKFDKKITELALEHVAANQIPDYIVEEEEEEAELEEIQNEE
jgi:hypothetical protein